MLCLLLVPYKPLADYGEQQLLCGLIHEPTRDQRSISRGGYARNHRHPALGKQSCTPEPRAPTTTTSCRGSQTPPT